jgi:hypothetical protein
MLWSKDFLPFKKSGKQNKAKMEMAKNIKGAFFSGWKGRCQTLENCGLYIILF